jgi:hypothetical protein
VGALALSTQDDYLSYQDGGDREDAEAARGTGETLNITTDVLIGVAALAAIGTGVLIFLDLRGGGDDADAALLVTPLVGPEHAGMALSARF